MLRPTRYQQPHSLYQDQKQTQVNDWQQNQIDVTSTDEDEDMSGVTVISENSIIIPAKCVNKQMSIRSLQASINKQDALIVTETIRTTFEQTQNNNAMKQSSKIKKYLIVKISQSKKEKNKCINDNVSGNVVFECAECHKIYRHFNNLKSHYNVHTPSAYVCKFCNKKFGRKGNYLEHKRIHTGEKPFKCHVCKRQFKQKHGWKNHMRA
eukprot:253634_1